MSNSGGVAVRPVTATRIAMNRSPAFQPRASASARSGGSSSSASNTTAGTAAIVSAAAASASRVVADVPALRDEELRIDREAVHPQEPHQVADRTERRQPVADDREERRELLVGRHPIDAAGLEFRGHERAQTVDELVRRSGAGSTGR